MNEPAPRPSADVSGPTPCVDGEASSLAVLDRLPLLPRLPGRRLPVPGASEAKPTRPDSEFWLLLALPPAALALLPPTPPVPLENGLPKLLEAVEVGV